MLMGAIIGDIVGSRFEWNNIFTKDFEFFHPDCFFTDDTVMTIAVAQALMKTNRQRYERLSEESVRCMQEIGRLYPHCGYGERFHHWIFADDPQPYGSWGNGAAMRVSACGWAARSLEHASELATKVTVVSHDHPESIKAAVAVSQAIYLLSWGKPKDEVLNFLSQYYKQKRTIADYRKIHYMKYFTCMNTMPRAIAAFKEGKDFEDTIRNAISIGGDSDTIAAIAGSLAEACWGVPDEHRKAARAYLDKPIKKILAEFGNSYSRTCLHYY